MTDLKIEILPSQRHLFEIPDNVTFLNCASLSPQLLSVTAAGLEAVKAKATPWKITPPDWFSGAEKLRELAALLVGTNADSIALVPSVSYGIAIAATNVKVEHGQNIIFLYEEYPSNYYAWRELEKHKGAQIRVVKKVDGGNWTTAILDAIDDKTAVVSVPNCHWTDGSFVDLERVGEKTRSVGAALVVDASQSLGAYPLDVDKVQPDFLVSAGYKWLLGAYALGIMYVASKYHESGKPIENSWLNRAGSENFSRLVKYRDEFRAGARRFDMGEFPNFALVPMLTVALEQILAWRVENIQNTISILTKMVAENAEKLGYLVEPEPDRISHLIGVKLPGGIPKELNEKLTEASVFISIRGDAIRIAPHLYNSATDIEKLFSVLEQVA
jgi:selenocysteine lyase/cysteine desulfurase